jgi:SAM-dependent methyltransferase
VALCLDCALVQILHAVPPELMFSSEYPYYSSFSRTIMEHARKNVDDLIRSRGLDENSFVVELASNDGYLLHNFVEQGIPAMGIEPAPGQAKAAVERGVPTLTTFFSHELAQKLRTEGRVADVVIANNVLAHVPDLNGFVAGIETILGAQGIAVIEVPYLVDLVDHCEFDTIYHEHHCYFSVSALDTLFRRHGLFINQVVHQPVHGGSLRLYAEKIDRPDGTVAGFLDAERKRGISGIEFYRAFETRVQGVRERLRTLLTRLKSEGCSIAAYGAAAKGTILANCVGIDTNLIDFVVDRNVHKHGRFMPGARLPIMPPSELLERMPDYVLLFSWNFRDEILTQEAEYRRRGGRFIVPIPDPEIIEHAAA